MKSFSTIGKRGTKVWSVDNSASKKAMRSLLMLILLKRMESDLRGTKCSLPLALALCCRLSTA